MHSEKILIVEDEILIADNLSRSLTKKGHTVVGTAISFEEARQMYLDSKPDLVLLDIRLNGPKTGIDVAQFIQSQPNPKPFIFLTSQIDAKNIDLAKETFPSGYLSKPIQKESLYTTIEIAMHKYHSQNPEIKTIPLYDGSRKHLVALNDILYLQAEHVYVQVFVDGGDSIIQRSSLKVLFDLLPAGQFVQTHRSFVVNTRKVRAWNAEQVYIGEKIIPVSRSRKKEVEEGLRKGIRK